MAKLSSQLWWHFMSWKTYHACHTSALTFAILSAFKMVHMQHCSLLTPNCHHFGYICNRRKGASVPYSAIQHVVVALAVKYPLYVKYLCIQSQKFLNVFILRGDEKKIADFLVVIINFWWLVIIKYCVISNSLLYIHIACYIKAY